MLGTEIADVMASVFRLEYGRDRRIEEYVTRLDLREEFLVLVKYSFVSDVIFTELIGQFF